MTRLVVLDNEAVSGIAAARAFAAGHAQELSDHVLLAANVGIAVGFQQDGELPFKRGIAGGVTGMRPQEVTKVDVIAMRPASRHDQVQMVIGGIGRWQERLPALDPEISLVPPSGSGQRLSSRTDGGLVRDDNVHVDNRLGSQAADRGAANVLSHVRDAGQHRVETVTQALEHPRPPRVILRDDRWNLHDVIMR
jgi:hypothetical protein